MCDRGNRKMLSRYNGHVWACKKREYDQNYAMTAYAAMLFQ